MTKIEPKILKGFRDFLPQEAKKRQYVIDTLKGVFASFGFEPLETPALEYEEILTGKYGAEGDKLMYRFTDRGDRKVALRYDQTVPLARVTAQYQNALPIPFKRYQVQNVWRAENTQKGRFREFLQCDGDIVGTNSPLADAEAIAVAAAGLEKLGFTGFKILVNDRAVFNDIPKEAITAIDKLKKIGRDGVIAELCEKKIANTTEDAARLLDRVENTKPTDRINEVFAYLQKMDVNQTTYVFSPTLARGLDYYTGIIFEIEIDGYSAGSVCGGGRYDNLIGIFAGKDIPAVGFAYGFDRVVDAMNELNLFPKDIQSATTKVLVTVFTQSQTLTEKSIETATFLRRNNVNTEIYMDGALPLEKQLKYANLKKIPYVIILGLNEVEKDEVTLKNMETGEQKQVPKESLLKEFS